MPELSNSEAESYGRMIELMRQMRRCEEEQGVLRSLKRRFKSLGEDTTAMVAMIRARRQDPGEVMAHERARIRFGRMQGIPFLPGDLLLDGELVDVGSIQRTADDPLTAEETGYAAGRGGIPYAENPYPAGSEAYVVWRDYWQQGQAAIAREMGPDGEQVEATRARPRRRRRNGAQGAAPNPASRASVLETEARIN